MSKAGICRDLDECDEEEEGKKCVNGEGNDTYLVICVRQ